MNRLRPLVQLTLFKIRSLTREPEALFWVFVFPVLLALALGIAFRSRPAEKTPVAVAPGEGAQQIREALEAAPEMQVEPLPLEEAQRRLRTGAVAIVVLPGEPWTYWFDPTRPDSRAARASVDAVLQTAAGRTDPVTAADRLMTEKGSRYIDFLIGLLAMEIGAALMLFWGAGLAVSMLTSRWRRWYAQLVLIALLVAMAALTVPVRSADFFITLLVGVLPLTWRLEGEADKARLSPAGLTPTIFLVGSIFLFQIQFFVLLAVVAWLLAFLLWFCMALTGFRLEALTLRWLPVLMISAAVAGLIVLLFIAAPRLSTGFIPGFATQQKIALTDHIAPGGMRDLLADDSIAFRAVPQRQATPTPRYWRVFVLDRERDGEWRRGDDPAGRGEAAYAGLAPDHSYLLLLDDHDPAMLPSPDWPRGFSRDYAYSRNGELMTGTRANPRRVIVGGGRDAASGATGGTDLSDRNPRLAAWARSTRPGVASDRDFVELLLRRFADTFSYDTTLDLPEADALDSFFFESRSGYCAYFATAMATALRAAGIEANIVTGYLGGAWNGYGGFWTVRNADAHAWVEARLDGGDWRRLDPTLGVMPGRAPAAASGEVTVADRPAARTGPDDSAGPLMLRMRLAGQWIEALNTRITIAVMDYGQDDAGGASGRRDAAALLFLGVGLAMTGVVAASAVIALRRLSRRRSRLEVRLERILGDRAPDAARRRGETLIGYVRRRAPTLPAGQAELATGLARDITAFRFAPASTIDGGRLSARLKRLRRLMRR